MYIDVCLRNFTQVAMMTLHVPIGKSFWFAPPKSLPEVTANLGVPNLLGKVYEAEWNLLGA